MNIARRVFLKGIAAMMGAMDLHQLIESATEEQLAELETVVFGSSKSPPIESPAAFAMGSSNGVWTLAPHLAYLNQKLLDLASGKIKRLGIFMPPRHGKLCADSTPVPTPNGWRLHGDLEPGDFVYDSSGIPVRVAAVSDPGQASLAVTFSEGTVVKVHPAHEWRVFDREFNKWRVLETQDMVSPGSVEPRRQFTVGRRELFSDIGSIAPCEPEPGKCIQVESDDGLYLVGDGCIPTHNSELTSRYFPAWYLGRNPTHKLILTSYEADFAEQWGRQARDLLEEFGPSWFGVEVSGQSSAAKRWSITQDGRDTGGGMITAGAGGAITGKGAHVLCIDDPIKNMEEANSPTYREKMWDWYRSVAYTRLEPDAGIILIQTRWNEDDLAGRILKQIRDGELGESEEWDLVNLPAIATSYDVLGREPGDPLWPERFTKSNLERIERVVGSYVWNALYQQNPRDEGATIIKEHWISWYQQQGQMIRYLGKNRQEKLGAVNPHLDCRRFATIDTAGGSEDIRKEKKGRQPSNSCCQVWDHWPEKDYLALRDCWTDRVSWVDMKDRIPRMLEKWGVQQVLIEDATLGQSLAGELRTMGYEVNLASTDNKDKVSRSIPLQNMLSRGLVFLPVEAPWLTALVTEWTSWTGHPDDQADRVDAAAYAASHVVKKSQASGKGAFSTLTSLRAITTPRVVRPAW